MQETAPHSIRHRIMMAFLLVIISWGIVLTIAINQAFETILLSQHVPVALVAEIRRHFILVCSGLTLTGFVIFYFVASYLSHAVIEPVQQLMRGVESLRGGNLNARVPISGQDEFAELASAFNRMAEQLGEIDRLKSEFISTVSHELRTPLTSIIGFSELLQGDEISSSDAREYQAIIYQKAEELNLLVESLLDMSRIEAGKGLHLDITRFDLAALARECLDGARLRSTRHQFDAQTRQGPLMIAADRFRIKQVLDNLLSNAIKYSPDGTITLTLTLDDTAVQLAVADQGIGMTEEQATRACEKFYRADASNTAVPGVGLGLSIVFNIVQAHQGELTIGSRPGAGTTITVRLPRNDHAEAMTPTEPQEEEQSKYLAGGSEPRYR